MRNSILIIAFLFVGLGKIQAQNVENLNPPVYPGCEKAPDKMKCMRENIIQLVGKQFHPEVLSNIKERPVSVECAFTITQDGEIEINEINTPYEPLKLEILKILSQISYIKPAEKDGVPIRIKYKIPFIFE